MDQVEQYFRRTPIAIIFSGQGQHRVILDYFGLARRAPVSTVYVCSVFRFKSQQGHTMTYTSHYSSSYYRVAGYTLISYLEFLRMISSERLQLQVKGVI